MTQIVECPACFGTGGLDQERNQSGKAWPCQTCKGRKVVIPGRYCECGDCAVWFDHISKLWYCGDKTCLAVAVGRRAKRV